MKAQDKSRYIDELKKILEETDFELLLKNCDDMTVIKKIHRAIAIFKNHRLSEGRKLEHLFKEFQRYARAGERRSHILNCLNDVVQFISQKTEEMDLVEHAEEQQEKQERVIKELKNEKLYVRQVLEGEDMHVFISEKGEKDHVHLIFDGGTGEIRIDPGDKPPLELLDKVASITTKSGEVIEATILGRETGLRFKEKVEKSDSLPVLYVSGSRRSGGPTGQFEYFTIKNISDNTAVDIKSSIRAFENEWVIDSVAFDLDPREEKEVIFHYPDQILHGDAHELNIVVEYKDAAAKQYFTRRELKLEAVPSGVFNVLRLDTFHPPSRIINDGLEFNSGPFRGGDNSFVNFSYPINGDRKTVKIGISGSLIAICGFSSDKDIKQALIELGHRKIRKMIQEGVTIEEYTFTSYDSQDNTKSGYDRYVSLRDSI